MTAALHNPARLEPATLDFYGSALDLLARHEAPILVGGAYALNRYTMISRHTKDLDIFVRRRDCQAVLDLFAREGYRTELTFPHWLGKVYAGDNVLDVIFSSGNAVVDVDDEWFDHAVEGIVLGRTVQLCPPEEIIWSKAFVMERERFDGADINHLLRACAAALDWRRLLRRFVPHWRLLLTHLILFGYAYPAEAATIPAEVMNDLLDRLRRERGVPPPVAPICQGTLLSRSQYLIDVQQWDYVDARLAPLGKMTAKDLAIWTAAVGIDNPSLGK
jgi:hypothetical protein